MANQNTPEYLEKIKTRLFENLRMLPHAPGVQVQAIPEDGVHESEEDEDKVNPDERLPQVEKVSPYSWWIFFRKGKFELLHFEFRIKE